MNFYYDGALSGKKMRKILIALIPAFLFSYEGYVGGTKETKPWFTGPLISGTANVVRLGHFNIEPYVFANAHTSFYGNDWKSISEETLWNLQFRVPLYTGLSDWADVKFTPVWNWNDRSGETDWTLGDWFLQVGVQVFRRHFYEEGWLPSVKIAVRETLPVGKYRNLNPDKLGTDGNGNGSWNTTLILYLSRIYHIRGEHFLNVCLDFLYSLPAPVHVKGYNAYGGGAGTNGTVYPDKPFEIDFAFEYSITRRWAVAMDMIGIWASKSRFSGKKGVVPADDPDLNPEGLPAKVVRDAWVQFTLAPAIEYNWSEHLGIIAGAYFTIAGKNSPHFTSGAIALNYYH